MNFVKVFIILIFITFSILGEKFNIVTNNWFPYFDPSLETKGLAPEILTAALEGRGYELEFKEIPWSRAEDGLKKGLYDVVINIWKTEERLKHFLYSDAYITNRLVFLKQNSDNFEFKNIYSLKNKKIGTIRGYYYGEEFMISNLFTRIPADDSIQNIKKLYAGRIDLYIDDEAVIKNILEKEFPRKNSSLTITKNSYMEKNLYLALSLKNEKAQSFIKDFNEGLYEIKKNGKYKKILSRYGLNK